MKYLKLGVMQTLVIERQKEFGAFLRAAEDTAGEETVLLPKKQVPAKRARQWKCFFIRTVPIA